MAFTRLDSYSHEITFVLRFPAWSIIALTLFLTFLHSFYGTFLWAMRLMGLVITCLVKCFVFASFSLSFFPLSDPIVGVLNDGHWDWIMGGWVCFYSWDFFLDWIMSRLQTCLVLQFSFILDTVLSSLFLSFLFYLARRRFSMTY